MKRLLSLILCGLLLAGLTLPAAAAEEAETDSADARLARVTQAVKRLLNLDTDVYEEFRGSCEEDQLVPVWSLYWTGGEEGSLTVEATEDGRIVSYRLGDYGTMPYQAEGGSLPAFPTGDQDAARAAASAFLATVLGSGETAQPGEAQGTDYLDRTSFTFYGPLLLNGLPSPLGYSITVRASDNQVTRFRRDLPDNSFLGAVPDSQAAVSSSQAASLLKGPLALRLEYVLPEEDAAQAVLRWLPEDIHRFAVDAGSGRLLDLTELEAELGGGRYDNGASFAGAAPTAMKEEAAADSSAGGLSSVEQAGVQKLEGVLTKEQLDAALRAVDAYGLESYGLSSAYFSLEKGETEEEDTVLCTLRYSRGGGEETFTRTITVEARTGEVQRIFSSAPWQEDGYTPALGVQQAREKAESFLQSFCPDRAGKLALSDTQDRTENGVPAYTFTFVQQENGYLFKENLYTVGIDAGDGSVYALSSRWTDVTFASPAGAISEEAALDAWIKTYDVTLGYSLVPRKLSADNGDLESRLLQQGVSYFYELRLTYALEREDAYLGIDAKTGKGILQESYDSSLHYSDLSGSAAAADIEALAKYGVGYDADAFQPDKALTQWDLVCLLASLQGYRLNPAEASRQKRDSAYRIAYSLGAVAQGEREEDAVLTRAALVKSLLDAAGYGPAARLEGIYTCAYRDADSIPANGLGYAAIAQARGLAEGTYAGARNATRAEAASMLCRLLER